METKKPTPKKSYYYNSEQELTILRKQVSEAKQHLLEQIQRMTESINNKLEVINQ